MSYLIRLFQTPAAGAPAALILRDTQISGSPPYRLRGLPWRALQSGVLVLDAPEDRAEHAQWLLGLAEQARASGKQPFDSSAQKAPFGDVESDHLDCADWEWSPDERRWMGLARHGEGSLRAPLFAFWLEQALRYNPLSLKMSPNASVSARFSYPPPAAIAARLCPIPLQAFQLQRLSGDELDIFLFALDRAGASPALPRPDSLPEPLASRLASTARAVGLDGFDLLSHRDPEAAAAREAHAISGAASPSASFKPSSRL